MRMHGTNITKITNKVIFAENNNFDSKTKKQELVLAFLCVCICSAFELYDHVQYLLSRNPFSIFFFFMISYMYVSKHNRVI